LNDEIRIEKQYHRDPSEAVITLSSGVDDGQPRPLCVVDREWCSRD